MNADIVIVGAGIAGLRCGITLLRKRPSRKIVILEKYNYVGGRVVTYHKKIEDIEPPLLSLRVVADYPLNKRFLTDLNLNHPKGIKKV